MRQSVDCSSVAILRKSSDDFWLAWTLHCLANATDLSGDERDGWRLHEESLRLFKSNGNRWGIALGLIGTGLGAARRGDYSRARELYEQGMALQRDLKIGYLSDTLNPLGRLDAATGSLDRAVERFRESLEHSRTHRTRWEGAFSLEGLADVALAFGLALPAVRFLAAAASIRSELAAGLTPKEQATFDRLVARAQASVDATAFEAEWTTGSGLTWEQVVAESLSLSFGPGSTSRCVESWAPVDAFRAGLNDCVTRSPLAAVLPRNPFAEDKLGSGRYKRGTAHAKQYPRMPAGLSAIRTLAI